VRLAEGAEPALDQRRIGEHPAVQGASYGGMWVMTV
jgi:hypothetical protein